VSIAVTVALDAMGSDQGAESVVAGARNAVSQGGLRVLLCGPAPELEPLVRNDPDIEVVHAPYVISHEEEPADSLDVDGDSESDGEPMSSSCSAHAASKSRAKAAGRASASRRVACSTPSPVARTCSISATASTKKPRLRMSSACSRSCAAGGDDEAGGAA